MTRLEKLAYKQFLADFKAEYERLHKEDEPVGRWHSMPLQVYIVEINKRQLTVCFDETIIYHNGERVYRGRQTSYRFANKQADALYTQRRLDELELSGKSVRLQ